MNANKNSATPINIYAEVFLFKCVNQMQCIIFGVKYTAKNDALHLIDTPKKKYPVNTID